MKNALLLVRSKDWSKNLLIFIPSFFSGTLLSGEYFYELLFAFISFSFVASSIYIINDIRDFELDKVHPKKCRRPIASEAITKKSATFVSIFIAIVGFYISFSINLNLFIIVVTYFILNILYSFIFKKIPIVDLVCIAMGFVLRVFAGAETSGGIVSEWLVLMVFLLSLLLGFAKRRDDLLIKEENNIITRKSIEGYSLDFVNYSIVFMAAVTVVCYILYSTNTEVVARVGSNNLYMTSAFVIIGIMRYMQITFVDEKSGSPTDILWKDSFIQVTIVFWLVLFGLILY